jgi:4-amino-4-deoxy-L-arabinose transferase-like glycosyltransferase
LGLVDGVGISGIQSGILDHLVPASAFCLAVFSGAGAISAAMALPGGFRQRAAAVVQAYAVVMVGALLTLGFSSIIGALLDPRWLAPFAAIVLLGLAADLGGMSGRWLRRITSPLGVITCGLLSGAYVSLRTHDLHLRWVPLDTHQLWHLVAGICLAMLLTLVGAALSDVRRLLPERTLRNVAAGVIGLIALLVLGCPLSVPRALATLAAVIAAAEGLHLLRQRCRATHRELA